MNSLSYEQNCLEMIQDLLEEHRKYDVSNDSPVCNMAVTHKKISNMGE